MDHSIPRIEMAPRTRRFMRELAGTDCEDIESGGWSVRPAIRRAATRASHPVSPRLFLPLLVAAGVAIVFLEIAWKLTG
jgi:hypothetical protein